jgi:hypothetical protein
VARPRAGLAPVVRGIAWAKQVLADHPRTPAILTTHEIVGADDLGQPASLSEHGDQLWTDLIKGSDQLFLTIGREWLLGGYEYGGKIDQIYYGLIGDVRIVGRPLEPDEFMIA